MALTSIHPVTGKLHVRTKFTQEHNRWNYENTRRYVVAFTKHYEKDMIDWMEAHKPYQTTFKRLVREEMEREAIRNAEASKKPL